MARRAISTAGPVDLRHLVLESVADQLVAVGAEGVGLDDVGARPAGTPGGSPRTRAGLERFSSSKQRLMKTPRAYSIVPIAPSQRRTESRRRSRNRVRHCGSFSSCASRLPCNREVYPGC